MSHMSPEVSGMLALASTLCSSSRSMSVLSPGHIVVS